MCRLCSGEHHFQAIGGISYITSFSCCEARGFVQVSHLSPYLHPAYIDFPILSHTVMSTTSTVTALVVCDSTLGDEHELANPICILVATHGDGTSFSHDSFQEEDLVELCMGLGQAYPEGVLLISETKILLKFQSTIEMSAMTCLLGVAMAWHDEPIRLCICPPTSTHIRDYAAVRGKHPFGTQASIPAREVVSWSPLVTPTLLGGPYLNSILPSGTLVMPN